MDQHEGAADAVPDRVCESLRDAIVEDEDRHRRVPSADATHCAPDRKVAARPTRTAEFDRRHFRLDASADCWGTPSAGTRLIRASAAPIPVALVVELAGSVRSLVQSRRWATADNHRVSIFLARPERPAHGIPLAVKDLFDTAGLVTTYGSIVFPSTSPSAPRSRSPGSKLGATRPRARRICMSSRTESRRRTRISGPCRTRSHRAV